MDITYSYSQVDEGQVLPLVNYLEKQFGGQKKPYYSKFGALDIVSFLEIAVSFSVLPYLKKYLEGLLSFDEAKKLGENHRDNLIKYYDYIESNVQKIVEVINYQYVSGLPKIKFNENEKALVLFLPLGRLSIYVVINHLKINNILITKIPIGVKNAFKYILTNKLPDNLLSIQLYFSVKYKEWRYLFIPSSDAFGNFINRYVDLQTGKLHLINSQSEFIDLFGVVDEDKYKFLITPFRS